MCWINGQHSLPNPVFLYACPYIYTHARRSVCAQLLSRQVHCHVDGSRHSGGPLWRTPVVLGHAPILELPGGWLSQQACVCVCVCLYHVCARVRVCAVCVNPHLVLPAKAMVYFVLEPVGTSRLQLAWRLKDEHKMHVCAYVCIAKPHNQCSWPERWWLAPARTSRLQLVWRSRTSTRCT